ncbi:hypothetical protein [Caballeronia sp. LZ028]|uniref:hypothetical protein n=1 Tax=Caballeronia sp. LZ028 TaxID=3038563 RepID=UPI0028604547|nr:hypothetical protein [Caballeronia sp. LZ028]MDR5770023.1 hypothetical protein [Caballeronia sp. LZ028]
MSPAVTRCAHIEVHAVDARQMLDDRLIGGRHEIGAHETISQVEHARLKLCAKPAVERAS